MAAPLLSDCACMGEGMPMSLYGELFLRGLLIGLSISIPVGPIGVLVIRRTLADGRLVGLACGVGCATGITLYGSVAGFGLTAISSFLLTQQLWLRLVGGLFLIYLGIRIFRAPVASMAAENTVAVKQQAGRSLLGAYASTLLLTLVNPAVIVFFLAIFANTGALGAPHASASTASYGSASVVVGGVFVGSALWWFALSVAVGLARTRLTAQWLRWANRISGVAIGGFGVLILLMARG
jgi:threonine/homoserine/homoserine lactone efflux protein